MEVGVHRWRLEREGEKISGVSYAATPHKSPDISDYHLKRYPFMTHDICFPENFILGGKL